ncbi:hypothetical protein J7I98_26680 [Streptomyces sp. ISL-98]|uniref:hypothetical protein n=1 Tax=Streptomyces sp. ISL-98 TaxID=2819192 RepID=UPI001BEC9265|nr:hypothetical protein [Streptomyces sp. ISL-98]MBT2509401.1 hypothetical protein [Streptomyces sp. ISL-98]
MIAADLLCRNVPPAHALAQHVNDGGWRKVLDQAHCVLSERLAKDGGEGETLNSLTMMLGMAAEYAGGGDLYQATVPVPPNARRQPSRPAGTGKSRRQVFLS